LPVSIMFSINQLVLKNKILLFLYVSSIPRALYYTALSSTLFFYIFPATALPLGSLHIFEIFQDRDRKIAGTETCGLYLTFALNISENMVPRTAVIGAQITPS